MYDSFELNAMVAPLNRLLLHGAGARRPAPRSPAWGWLAVPKVLLGKIKRAFLGGPRRGGVCSTCIDCCVTRSYTADDSMYRVLRAQYARARLRFVQSLTKKTARSRPVPPSCGVTM